MSAQVKFIVCGITQEGYGWTDSQSFGNIMSAIEHAESWSKHESEVWVEKVTTYNHIVWSVSSDLPQKEAMPV